MLEWVRHGKRMSTSRKSVDSIVDPTISVSKEFGMDIDVLGAGQRVVKRLR